MKKVLYVLALTMALWMTPQSAMCDNTGMQQRVESTSSVTGGTGCITLVAGSSDAVFQVYSITGQLLKTVRLSADGHTSVDIPKGFYVVRCNGQWSRKVIVR